ncbi:RNA helicase, partial [Pseudoalteromonas piscicida]
ADHDVPLLGRTARAGQLGYAITFLSREDQSALIHFEQIIAQHISRYYLPGSQVANREKLADTFQKKAAHPRRKARVNKPSNQGSEEAR